MGSPKPPLTSVLAAVAFALSCFVLGLFVWRSFGGPVPTEAEGYRFHARFGTEASQIAPGSDVRISGVPVGHVTAANPTGERIDVEIEMDSPYAPVPSDTRAIVRYKTLLGESFIELSQGSADAAPVPEDGELAPEQTQPAQQIDQVLSAFDPRTRRAFKQFVGGLARTLDGRGDELNAALGNAAPVTEQLAAIVEVLDRQRDAVGGLVRDSAATFQAIGRDEAALQSLVTAGDSVLSATAERNTELTQTVQALPPTLTILRTVLANAEGLAGDAAPTLAALRPAAPLLRPALASSLVLAPELERLFGQLVRSLPVAREALPAATETVRAVIPAVDALYPAGRELVPVVQYLGQYKRELVTGIANTASATQASTPRGDGSDYHYLRVVPPVWTEDVFGLAQRLPSNRFNPYFRPRAQEDLLGGGQLPSFSCAHTSNPPLLPPVTGAPPCVEQPPWPFGDVSRSYHHVEALP